MARSRCPAMDRKRVQVMYECMHVCKHTCVFFKELPGLRASTEAAIVTYGMLVYNTSAL